MLIPLFLSCTFHFNFAFSDNNPIVELLQIAIPTITAIFAALLPFYLSKNAERNREFSKLQNLESYYYVLLTNFIERTKEQIEHNKKFIASLNDKATSNFSVIAEPGFLFEKVDKISNQESIYKIFVLGKNLDSHDNQNSLLKIFKSIEGTKLFVTSLKWRTDLFNKKYEKYQNEWNENGDAFIRKYELDAASVHRGKVDDNNIVNFLVQASVTIGKWQKLNTTNIFTTKEELIEPIRQLAANLNVPEYLSPIMNALAAHKNIENLRSSHVSLFEKHNSLLTKNYLAIEQEINTLRSIPLRPATEWV